MIKLTSEEILHIYSYLEDDKEDTELINKINEYLNKTIEFYENKELSK